MEPILKELEVTTTAIATFLILDLVLDDKRLVGEVDGCIEGRRDGVVSGLRLSDETLVTRDDRRGGLFELPLADIAERLGADGGLLGRLGGRPTF